MRAVVQGVRLLLAISLGFTCLALFYFPSDIVGDGGNQVYYQLSSSARLSQHINWKRYLDQKIGHPYFLQEENDFYNSSSKSQQPLLENVPRFFQEQLLSGLPLSSYPGPEGLFRPRYDRFLKTLMDYANYHSQMRSSPSFRVLTWQCTTLEYCGGLGDRIRGVTYALLLAIFSRRRLVVFWEGPPEGYHLDPHLINWRDDRVYDFLRVNSIVGNVETDSQLQTPYIFKFHVIADKSGRIINDVQYSDMEYYQRVIGSNLTHVVISTNLEPSSLVDAERSGNQEWIRSGLKWSGLSHLSPSELDDVVGVVFRYLFRLKDDVLEEVQVARRVLGLDSSYAALHLRTGFAGMDHYEELPRHPKLEHNVSKWHSSLHCAVAAADKFLGNDSLLFLATDSNLVKDIAVSKYGQRIRTLMNPLIHLDKLHKEVNLKVDPTVKEGVLVVWVEFLLLAQSKVLIRGESGFSWIAGLISGMRTVSTNNCTL